MILAKKRNVNGFCFGFRLIMTKRKKIGGMHNCITAGLEITTINNIRALIKILLPKFYNSGPERSQRQPCQFEALLSKGNADDGNTENTSQHSSFYCHGKTGYQQPDQIKQGGDTAAIPYHIFSKGEKGQ